MEYRDYEIEIDDFGLVVTYCGDEVIFKTVNEAKAFIDEIHKHKDDPDWWI